MPDHDDIHDDLGTPLDTPRTAGGSGAPQETPGSGTSRTATGGESATTAEQTDDQDRIFEAQSADAFGSDDELPSEGLLSFYDRLRERVLDSVEKKGGRLGATATRTLLLVPDVFILLVRLALDRDVPSSARMMIGGALAYFVLPMDLLPEALVGVGGYVDDMVLATAVLAQAFSGDLEPYARRHWSGSEDLRVVIRDISYTAENLLGTKLYKRVEKVLERRGVKLPQGEGLSR